MSNLRRWIQVGQGDFLKWTDPGQEVEGVWQGQKDGKFGPIGMVDTPYGRKTFPLHTALLSLMESVKEGAEVKIIYTGKQKAKASGNEFKAFDVFVASADMLAEEPVSDDDVHF